MTDKLSSLQGLGPKSASQLESIGIHTKNDLVQLGAIPAYLKLKQHCKGISLNFLYVLVGIVEDKSWREIAATRREELLLHIDGYAKLADAISNSPRPAKKPASSVTSRSSRKA